MEKYFQEVNYLSLKLVMINMNLLLLMMAHTQMKEKYIVNVQIDNIKMLLNKIKNS